MISNLKPQNDLLSVDAAILVILWCLIYRLLRDMQRLHRTLFELLTPDK